MATFCMTHGAPARGCLGLSQSPSSGLHWKLALASLLPPRWQVKQVANPSAVTRLLGGPGHTPASRCQTQAGKRSNRRTVETFLPLPPSPPPTSTSSSRRARAAPFCSLEFAPQLLAALALCLLPLGRQCQQQTGAHLPPFAADEGRRFPGPVPERDCPAGHLASGHQTQAALSAWGSAT